MSNQDTRRHPPQYSESPSGAWPNDPNDASPLSDEFPEMNASSWPFEQYIATEHATDEDHGLSIGVEYSEPSFASSQYVDNALGLNIAAPSNASSYLGIHPHYYNPGAPYHHPRNTPSLAISTDVPHSPYGRFQSISGSHSPVYPPMSAAPSSASPALTGQDSMPRTPASLPMGTHPLHSIQTYSPSSPYAYGPASHLSPTKSHSPYMSPGLLGNIASPVAPMSFISPPIPGPSVPITTVLDVAGRFPGFDHIVPQKTYRPNTQSDRRRYVEEVQLEAPILFFLQGPEGLGINCKDAMTSRFSRLVDRDDAMFENRGPSVSIRLNWPGYPPWSRQIPTRDFRSPPGPITRSKLAKNVAKTVQRFLDEKRGKAPEDDAPPKWKLADITIDQLELIGLQHVSMGSWQAHLRLRPRT